MFSTTTTSCPEAAATLAPMNGTIARSGSSRPWVQWNSILVTWPTSRVVVAPRGQTSLGSRRRGGAVAGTRMVVVGGDAAGLSAAPQARRAREAEGLGG